MKFSVRMFRQMVMHVLYLEKENGNVLYLLPEKRVVPVEKQLQMKRSIFSGTCNSGQMVQKFPGIPVKASAPLATVHPHCKKNIFLSSVVS